MYGENNKIGKALFDVNKQISSGQKIEYAYEDTATFIDTMRLDNEATTLTQVKKSTQSAYKFSTQTDTVLGDFSKTLDSIKVKLVDAANGSHSDTSMNAIAQELRGLENHMKNLANTSINGQYLFSGTQTSTKPIDGNGNYVGNDGDLQAFLGNDIKQRYNISGAELFLGDESNTQRKITTNVKGLSLNDLYPDVMQASGQLRTDSTEKYLTANNTIRDLMGDTDSDTTNDPVSHFYIRATKSDGVSFKSKYDMTSDQKISDLLDKIKTDFGGNVNVSLNEHGQIEIEDKMSNSSKLDFHMVGAVDFDTAALDDADVTDIDALDDGERDFKHIADSTSSAVKPNLYIKEFVKSDFSSAANTASNIDAIVYDRTQFSKDGMNVHSNIAQIIKSDNSIASNSTKLLDVFSPSTLDSQQLILNGTDINGVVYNVQIDLASSGSTFSLDGGVTNYDIYDNASPRAVVDADKMTYRELMDVMNMVVTNELPASTNSSTDYDNAIIASNEKGKTQLDSSGKIMFDDLTPNITSTQASISMYDANSSDFTKDASIATFNSNNALTIRDPKTDFFSQLDEAISAVEKNRHRADGNAVDPRNLGVQNGIQIIDDLNDHVSRMQTQAGAQSQSLDAASQRSELLLLNTQILRSEVLDTDVAEASMRLQQLSLNYQAMYSSISRISQLSLVNYL
jgi:flagellar hook-associated protein 3 FlgL